MKKFTLALLLLVSTVFTSKATHLMGGEITMLHLGNQQYLVTLIAYRDTVGVQMAQMATFEFRGPNNQQFTKTTPYDSIISGNLLPMYPYGVEIYLFMDTVTLPSYGHWTVSWSNCCRNGAIQNLSNPLGESMWLQTSIVTDSLSSNSTPYFLVPAAIYLPLNTPWQYNPLPFDVDGDSLHWSIDQPLTSLNQYCAGYVDPSSDTNDIFRIDPITGTISWTADMLGNFVASILVEQYRDGVWVGDIRRDMQFIVVNPGQGFPVWTNLSSIPVDPQNNYSFNLIAGKSFNLEMIAGHTDSTRSVYLDAYSEVFGIPNSNATFVQTKSTEAKGIFNWQPTMADIRPEPYVVVFRASDRFFTDDKSVMLKVNTGIGLEELEMSSGVNVYPNPANDIVYLNINEAEKQNIQIEVYAINGQQILKRNKLTSQEGTNLYIIETRDWQPGAYVLKVTGDKGLSSNQMLMVE